MDIPFPSPFPPRPKDDSVCEHNKFVVSLFTAIGVAALFSPLKLLGWGIGIVAGFLLYYIWDCDPKSPLILDLDGDGVEADALTYFDHEGDGWDELSRWANEDDGVLVWDKNKDGKINDGSELFGDNSVKKDGSKAAHGFAALSDIDDNGDGVIDVQDTAWSDLKIMRWKDADGDGIKDDGEEYFQTLAQAGVKSLDTGYTDSTKVDKSGNEHRQVGSYTKADDSKATMTDVWFVTAQNSSKYDRVGIPSHNAVIKGLPEIAGRGRLYSLRDAMAYVLTLMGMQEISMRGEVEY